MADNDRCGSASQCTQESCEGCAGKSSAKDKKEAQNGLSFVKRVIAIVSGKGGVGKSFVTASLAAAMRKEGYKTGILDADITGPSIPKMFGIHGPAYGTEEGMPALPTENGILIMSMNLLADDEEMPVIWRGPVISGAVRQFWTDVIWGELDFLFVDMPPGTGDVPLTVFQSLPVDGILIVTSPQELVGMIVKKAYHMANLMQIPVLGIVENFSYLTCPGCGEKISVFGESRVDQAAAELSLPVFGKLPIDSALAKAADEGRFHETDNPHLKAAVEALRKMAAGKDSLCG